MPETKWTRHVKAFAREHNLSYGCAMSMPECRQSYHKSPRVRRPRERKERPSRRQRRPRERQNRISEEEQFYRRNPQLNIERMAGDYDY